LWRSHLVLSPILTPTPLLTQLRSIVWCLNGRNSTTHGGSFSILATCLFSVGPFLVCAHVYYGVLYNSPCFLKRKLIATIACLNCNNNRTNEASNYIEYHLRLQTVTYFEVLTKSIYLMYIKKRNYYIAVIVT